ncbi:MAG: CoA pyrophosphatase [Gammaproteobacteria bacterium]|nr:CoA pyrophosphatase [Gammaproteobacteria bacterium]
MQLTPEKLQQALQSPKPPTADVANETSIEGLTPAGVLVPLIQRQVGQHYGYHLLLTRRAHHLKHHPGQISFPGGRHEEYDRDLAFTALRETYEEVGIKPSKIQILGQLPKHTTITNYLMTPFVGLVDHDYSLTLDQGEVAEAFEVPLSFIVNPANHSLQSAMFQGEKRYYYSIRYHDYNIWGATARILVELSKCLAPYTHSTTA